jgi:hypothetical protein
MEDQDSTDLLAIKDDVTLVSILRQLTPAHDDKGKSREPIALEGLEDFTVEATAVDSELAGPFVALLPTPDPPAVKGMYVMCVYLFEEYIYIHTYR